MPKVEDVSIWLRWAVDPDSALRVLLLPPLLALLTSLFLLLLRWHLPVPLQEVDNPFTAFFLLSHPTAAPERLSLLAYSIVLFPFLRLELSHRLFPMLARR
jgi:hypothetical protein